MTENRTAAQDRIFAPWRLGVRFFRIRANAARAPTSVYAYGHF